LICSYFSNSCILFIRGFSIEFFTVNHHQTTPF